MHLAKLASSKFVVTCEISSPKGTNLDGFLNSVDSVKDYVDAINIADNQRAVMRAGPLAICNLLKKRGIEPVMELAARDKNRLALQSDLLAAAIMDIENVTLVTGHDPTLGDHAEAKPVYDLDSVSLVDVAVGLIQGKDMAGHPIDGAPDFCLGVVASPGLVDDEKEMSRLKEKLHRGARFIQTQPVYEPEVMEKFVEAIKDFEVPVFAGHVILKSASMASFMNSNFPGIKIPDSMIRKLEGLPRDKVIETTLEISVELIKNIKPFCQGICFIPEGWERYLSRVVEQIGV